MVADTDPPPRRIDVTSFDDKDVRSIGTVSIDLEARLAKFESDMWEAHRRTVPSGDSLNTLLAVSQGYITPNEARELVMHQATAEKPVAAPPKQETMAKKYGPSFAKLIQRHLRR